MKLKGFNFINKIILILLLGLYLVNTHFFVLVKYYLME